MPYTLQGGDNSNQKRWIMRVAIVTAVTIGLVVILCSINTESGGSSDKANGVPATGGVAQTEEPLPEAAERVRALVQEARDALAGDNLALARQKYMEALADKDCGDATARIEEDLARVNIDLIFSQREMPGKVERAIKPGESLRLLANRYGTTVDLIVKGNDIKRPDKINAGDRVRLLDKPDFEISVSKSRNFLLVTLGGKFFKRYTVGTGKYNKTPAGTFRVKEKIENPNWWKDGKEILFGDKENILGTRWMELEATGSTPPAKGYGIHGTWDDSSLGQQSSAGCVRMRNGDVEELFVYIPVGAKVTISD